MQGFSTTYRLIALTVALVFGLGAAGPGMCSTHGDTAMPDTHDHSRNLCAAPCHVAKTPPQTIQAFQSTTDRQPSGPDGPALLSSSIQFSRPLLQHHTTLNERRDALPRLRGVRLHLLHAVFLN